MTFLEAIETLETKKAKSISSEQAHMYSQKMSSLKLWLFDIKHERLHNWKAVLKATDWRVDP